MQSPMVAQFTPDGGRSENQTPRTIDRTHSDCDGQDSSDDFGTEDFAFRETG